MLQRFSTDDGNNKHHIMMGITNIIKSEIIVLTQENIGELLMIFSI